MYEVTNHPVPAAAQKKLSLPEIAKAIRQTASDEPLFGDEGLGLDSIDALELGVALRKNYGIRIDTVTDEVKSHFANVRNLAAFIRARREGAAQ